MPWAGGLNYAQFSDIDYDFDGDLDLLVFDRSNNQLRIFEHIQTAGISSYRYDPFGEQWFPSDMRYRLFAIDYNGDNKKDLFDRNIKYEKVQVEKYCPDYIIKNDLKPDYGFYITNQILIDTRNCIYQILRTYIFIYYKRKISL